MQEIHEVFSELIQPIEETSHEIVLSHVLFGLPDDLADDLEFPFSDQVAGDDAKVSIRLDLILHVVIEPTQIHEVSPLDCLQELSDNFILVCAEMNGIEYGPHIHQLFVGFEKRGKGLEISVPSIALDHPLLA